MIAGAALRVACRAAAAGTVLALAGTTALAQRPLNLGFESASVAYADRPWGWTLGWSAFAVGSTATFTLDSVVRVEGRRSLRVTASDTSTAAAPRMMMLQLPSAFARGRTLRLTGRVRASDLRGRALVLLEGWGNGTIDAGDTLVLMRSGGDWQAFDLTIRVPAAESVHSVTVSAGVQGSGQAWFDAFAMQLDGTPIPEVPGEVSAPTAADIAWLAARSTPLATVEAGTGDDADLEPVLRIIGDARIVGLGESTHGTREFFQAKDRVLDLLVRRRGFDLFAVEANQLGVERLNRYVLGLPGAAATTREALRVMFRVWNTEEMAALVDRVRAHNAANPARPVRFVGYDMQDHRTPYDSLLAFVARVEPAMEPRVRALGAEYRAERSAVTPQVPDGQRAAWRAQAESLWTDVRDRRGRWLAAARTTDDSVRTEWAVQSANLFRQAALLNETLRSPDRDSLMAANLDWALRTLYPRSRVVVWAHDVHVSKGGDPGLSFNAGAQMGAHLARSYRHDYRAFSLLTRAGAYSATRSFSDHAIIAAEAFAPPAGSIEAAVARVGRPAGSVGLVVDLRSRRDDPRAAWLWRPRPIRHVGYAAYDYAFDLKAVMPLEFDGVIYVERTTASRMLP